MIIGDDILLVDDDEQTLQALARVLEDASYTVRTARSAKSALESVKDALPAIVLLDLGLPDANGVDVLRNLLANDVPQVIIISGTDSVETTRQCLREGAFDFLLKPAQRDELLQAVRRATSSYQVNRVITQEYPIELQPGFGSLETPSYASQQMFKQLKDIATESQTNAIITGPAGLFKRDIAALLHHYTGKSGPALLINCALEIGEKAEARFSGQSSKSGNPVGYLEMADNGTLILDDISLLPVPVQSLLARHITLARELSNTKNNNVLKNPCSIVGILKEPIDFALSEGRLQPELFDILSANRIGVPALKDRPDDIVVFAQQAVSQLNILLQTEKSLAAEFSEFLKAQTWEGNLIDLKNRLLTAYRATGDGDEIIYDPMHWPTANLEQTPHSEASTGVASLVGMSLIDAENLLIKATLASVGDNKSKASKILGISVKTLYNRLKN